MYPQPVIPIKRLHSARRFKHSKLIARHQIESSVPVNQDLCADFQASRLLTRRSAGWHPLPTDLSTSLIITARFNRTNRMKFRALICTAVLLLLMVRSAVAQGPETGVAVPEGFQDRRGGFPGQLATVATPTDSIPVTGNVRNVFGRRVGGRNRPGGPGSRTFGYGFHSAWPGPTGQPGDRSDIIVPRDNAVVAGSGVAEPSIGRKLLKCLQLW